jgi:hypothetical protein
MSDLLNAPAYMAPAPKGLRRPWALSLWGAIVLLALLVLLTRIFIGTSLGVDETTLDAFARLSLIFIPVLWFGALIEALRAPDWLWKRAGQNKGLYVALIVFLVLLGSVLYILIARRSLRAVAKSTPAN